MYRDGWNCFLYDTMTGLLGQQIDIPSFTWSMSVSDASFSTSKDKGFGEDEVSGIELPWSQIPGDTPAARASALMPYKRGIVLFWHSTADDPNLPGRPVLAGALGVRRSTRDDVSMPFVSMLGMLEDRYLVHEGRFGAGSNHSSPDVFEWKDLSYRALACETIRHCTEYKPGGTLPIDLPYLNEEGTHRLPEMSGDEEQKPESDVKKKTSVKTRKKNGWVETTTDGDTVMVVDHTETVTTKVIDTTEKYTVRKKDKHGNWVREERTRPAKKTIKTGRTVVEVKTVTKPKGESQVEKSVTRTTTVYRYDGAGKEIGSDKTVVGPTVTVERKPTTVKYRDYNVTNHRCSDILRSIANSTDGPDMQFRPYLTEDGMHIRFRFLSGSDGDVYLYQDKRLSLSWCAGEHSTLDNVSVDRAAPVHRVYGVGAGMGNGTLCHLAEDLRLVRLTDPWPLVEQTYSDSKADDFAALRNGTTALLRANSMPLMQIKGELDAFETDASGMQLHPFGSFWPGEVFDLSVQGFPDLPDGVYSVRLMQMSGDETGRASLTFDIMADPVY